MTRLLCLLVITKTPVRPGGVLFVQTLQSIDFFHKLAKFFPLLGSRAPIEVLDERSLGERPFHHGPELPVLPHRLLNASSSCARAAGGEGGRCEAKDEGSKSNQGAGERTHGGFPNRERKLRQTRNKSCSNQGFGAASRKFAAAMAFAPHTNRERPQAHVTILGRAGQTFGLNPVRDLD
jgi:hypothetical protein